MLDLSCIVAKGLVLPATSSFDEYFRDHGANCNESYANKGVQEFDGHGILDL